MTFREINEAIYALVDMETGEILDEHKLDEIEMEFRDKVQNVGLWILDIKDENENLATEIQRLQSRKKQNENKIESLKKLLNYVTGGKKFKTDLVTVSFRETESVKIGDPSVVIDWAQKTGRDNEVLSYAEPTISKTELKKMLKMGEEIPTVSLDKNVSTIVK